MKITPAPTKILLEAERPTVGMLDTSSREVAIEVGIVKEVGEVAGEFYKIGDKLLFKSYGVATVDYAGKKLTFLEVTSEAIQGKIDD